MAPKINDGSASGKLLTGYSKDRATIHRRWRQLQPMPESPPPRRRRDVPSPPPGLGDFLDKSPGVTVHCPRCFRAVGFPFRGAVELAGENETIDGLKRRLRCVECGTRGAGTDIYWPGTSPWNGQYPDF